MFRAILQLRLDTSQPSGNQWLTSFVRVNAEAEPLDKARVLFDLPWQVPKLVQADDDVTILEGVVAIVNQVKSRLDDFANS